MKDFSYRVGNQVLLKNINWTIKEHENWLILGLNGSGKTTLLSVASGYLPSEDGTINLLGEPLTVHNRRKLCQQVGLVSENFFSKYFRNETMNDIIFGGYYGQLGQLGDLTDKQILYARKLMRQFGINQSSRKPFWLLSKGERQKGLLIRALVHKPQMLFLDEPCSGLDIFVRMQLLQLFSHLFNEGISLIFVSHHFDEITNIYQKAMLLRQGECHSQGELTQILHAENLSDFFHSNVQIDIQKNGHIHFEICDKQKALVINFPKQEANKNGT